MRIHAVDVAVIGGGIVGCTAALDLARGGATVTLFEAADVGAGASGRNSGVVQHPFDDVLTPLHRATLERYRQLTEEVPEAFALQEHPAGLLLLAPDGERSLLEAERAAIEAVAPESEPTMLASAEVVALEPSLAPDLAALRLETGYPVPPAAAVAAFAGLAAQAGAHIETGDEVTLEGDGDTVAGVRRADGRKQIAGAVLVAAGPWSPDLIDQRGRWRPIVRTWGVTVTTRLASPPGHVLEQAGVIAINRADAARPENEGASADQRPPGPADDSGGGSQAEPEGHFPSTFSLVTARGITVVGSTFLTEEPDPGSVGPILLHRADRFVPGLHAAGIDELRACARPQSLDGRPLVGLVAGYRNLYIAAGHGPWGISTGPATAGLVADLVLGRPTAIPPELDPARFP